MNEMQITSAQYIVMTKPDGTTENTTIKATVNGQKLFVPISAGNRHYSAIMQAVADGQLTIQEASE